MEKKSSKLFIGSFDRKEIQLDIMPHFLDDGIQWFYIVTWGEQEFVRSSVENVSLADLMNAIYISMDKKGISIHQIRKMRFIRDILKPHIKNLEFTQYLLETNPDHAIDFLNKWNT